MKIFRMIKDDFYRFLYDSSIYIKDRTFVLFSILYFAAVIAALIVGLFLKEPLPATLVSFGVIVVSFFFLMIIAKKKLYKVGKVAVAFVMIAVFQPSMFFTKGGIYCGAPFTLLLGTYYLVMILDGKFRIVMCILDAFVLGGCWGAAYFYPDLVNTFSRETDFIYSFVKYIIVTLVLTVIISFQTRVYQREAKLSEQKTKELEELNRSQNRFFSSMSHEIRTPINTVLGMNEIILRQEDASEEIRKDARNIQGAGKLLLALINDILDISKIEAGKMDIVPVDYNVAALLSEIVNMIWLKAEEKGLKFSVDIDPNVPELMFGDEVRIKQVLINLLNNAVKYTKEGSVSLHMECEFPENGGVLLKINVSDTGMGIRPEALPHLFDTFQRQDEEKNRHIEGTGLGLSIVKQLVELMDGEITVNSVYGQGSTFAVSIKQGISSEKRVGDINITNAGGATGEGKFEHSFYAPNARILIVDDNEMNLEVERKLLDGTEMTVDLAYSGAEALTLTLRNRYDVIFMDHLMPEMDGIRCYERVRTQKGGLNQKVPIVVLTANAGGENIELYNRTGFDGYLVKPVSGRQLENMLLLHLPEEKVQRRDHNEMTSSQMNTASGYAKKKPVVIATSSMADLPQQVIRDLQISIEPYVVITGEGTFLDNIDLDSEELIRYMGEELKFVDSDTQDEESLIQFLANELKKAHHVIYITLSTSASKEYGMMSRAAKTFENVTVINSETLSSGTGMLAMVAARLAQQNLPVEKIVSELEKAKALIHCSFVIRSTEVMARRGQISPFMSNILSTLWLRPMLRMKKNKLGVGHFYLGSEKNCYEKYINDVLSPKIDFNKEFVFVTYAGLEEEQLLWIEEMIRKRVAFEHIIFQTASAGITSNCGAGSFGILYMTQGENSYNLGSLFDVTDDTDIDEQQEEEAAEEETGTEAAAEEAAAEPVEEKEKPWYALIEGLDPEAAVKNSGSEESFLSVLKIYYDSYGAKAAEIRKYYEEKDWENYTIKVHALKSSSRLVGALQIGNAAEALEMAGKEQDTAFIEANHDALMAAYEKMHLALEPAYGAKEDLPEIPAELLEDAYGGLSEFVHAMDYELVKMVLDSVEEYRLPKEDAERFAKIKDLLAALDWDGIAQLLN